LRTRHFAMTSSSPATGHYVTMTQQMTASIDTHTHTHTHTHHPHTTNTHTHHTTHTHTPTTTHTTHTHTPTPTHTHTHTHTHSLSHTHTAVWEVIRISFLNLRVKVQWTSSNSLRVSGQRSQLSGRS